MFKSLLLVAIGSVVAKKGCVDTWCSVTRNVVELPSTFATNYSECIEFCLLSDGFGCQAFNLDPVDSPEGVCTRYKFDETGTLQEVFANFPTVDLSKVLPDTVYTYKQLGEPKTVTGFDQCRDELRASSVHPVFANFGNQACGTEQPIPPVTIIDGARVQTEVILTFKYIPATEALGVAPPGYLTLIQHGFGFSKSPGGGSYWTWSHGGVAPSYKKDVCMGAEDHHPGYLIPIYINGDEHSRCKMGMRGGSPDGASPLGWVMQDIVGGPFKCMGNVTPTTDGLYLVAIEDPVDGKCNTQWKVEGAVIDNSALLSRRACDAGDFDGEWVDGPLFSPGDFSREWFDTLTISSGDDQLNAHTKEGDFNYLHRISIDGCSITVYVADCDTCGATGTLSEGRDTINWAHGGFNDGDYWIRKNQQQQGCCTFFDATLKPPSSLASPPPGSNSSPEDTACAKQFSGRWVDRSGDFQSIWVPYMDLSVGRPEDEVEDDTNGRMTAPKEQGSWVLPVKFFQQGDMCKLKLCTAKQCPVEAYAIGTLEADEIHWDVRLNKGKWVRFTSTTSATPATTTTTTATGENNCRHADSKYSCCDATPTFGCAFAPNKAVCDLANGTFCCDPLNGTKRCGFEPTTTTTTPTMTLV